MFILAFDVLSTSQIKLKPCQNAAYFYAISHILTEWFSRPGIIHAECNPAHLMLKTETSEITAYPRRGLCVTVASSADMAGALLADIPILSPFPDKDQ